jgi:hypothetical protein
MKGGKINRSGIDRDRLAREFINQSSQTITRWMQTGPDPWKDGNMVDFTEHWDIRSA